MLLCSFRVEKEKEKEKVVTEDKSAVKTQKVRPAAVVKTDSQDKRTPKPRKALSSKGNQGNIQKKIYKNKTLFKL